MHPASLIGSLKGGVDMLEFHMKLWGFKTKRNKSFVLRLSLRVAPIKVSYHTEIWIGRKKFISVVRESVPRGILGHSKHFPLH